MANIVVLLSYVYFFFSPLLSVFCSILFPVWQVWQVIGLHWKQLCTQKKTVNYFMFWFFKPFSTPAVTECFWSSYTRNKRSAQLPGVTQHNTVSGLMFVDDLHIFANSILGLTTIISTVIKTSTARRHNNQHKQICNLPRQTTNGSNRAHTAHIIKNAQY